jgi:hypothetical protein
MGNCLPLSFSVVLVVLFSDSLHAIFPAYSTETYKLLSLFILIPTAFLPLRVISYTSLLSVFSTLFIGIVLVVGGLTKYETPGSLYEFAPTDWWPAGPRELGLSFGIFMAGVSFCYRKLHRKPGRQAEVITHWHHLSFREMLLYLPLQGTCNILNNSIR